MPSVPHRSRRTCRTGLAACAVTVATFAAPLHAQTLSGRPFHTESADTLPDGGHAIEVGLAYMGDIAPVPLLGSTVRGDLLEVPTLRYRLGLGRAELQVGGTAWQSFSPDPAGAKTEDEVGDLEIATKVRLLADAPGRIGVGLLVGVKLPNADDLTGLGTDETDAFLQVLLSNTTREHEFRLALGLAILGDPLRNDSQEDLLTYGIAGRHGHPHSFIWEAWGRALSSDARELDESRLRLGYAYWGRQVVFDVSAIVGLEKVSGDLGLSAGATWLLGHAADQ